MRSKSWGGRLRRIGLAIVLGASLTAAVSVSGGTAAATTPTWSNPVPIDPDRGGISSISCPTTTFCMAVGSTGRAVIYNGHWLPAVQVETVRASHGFTSVSCTGPTFCVAVDEYGRAARFDGTRWTVQPVIPEALLQVSCGAADNCVAVSYRTAVRLSGSTWTRKRLIAASTASVHAVSCASRIMCVAVGYDTAHGGIAYRFTGANWTVAAVASLRDNVGLTAVDCPTPRYCLAAGTNGVASVFGGSRWVSPGPDYGGFDTSSVSCPSTARCLAVGSGGGGAATTRTWTAAGWSTARLIDPGNDVSTVSCATTTWCLAGDRGGQVLRSSFTTWTGPVYADARYSFIESVSCADASFCFATDEDGDALRWDGTRWSRPGRIELHVYQASTVVSCVSRSFCLMGDNRGNTRRWDGTAWRVAPANPQLLSLSCVSAHFCVAATGEGESTVFTGSAWTRPVPALRPSDGALSTISCASTTFCAAADSSSRIVNRFDGAHWATPARLPGTGDAAGPSCPTASTACTVVVADGHTYQWNGTSWVRLAATTDGAVYGLACTGPSFCVATQPQQASTFDGIRWTTQPLPAAADGSALYSVDCVDSSFCAAGGGAYAAIRR